MNLIWRLTARLVWLWVGILVRGITINVNWQYLVSGSSLPAASWLTRIPPNVGSGRSRWEYTMFNVIKVDQVQDQVWTKSFNKTDNFWDRSKTYQFVKLERLDLFTPGWGAWRCPAGYLPHGEWGLNREKSRSGAVADKHKVTEQYGNASSACYFSWKDYSLLCLDI